MVGDMAVVAHWVQPASKSDSGQDSRLIAIAHWAAAATGDGKMAAHQVTPPFPNAMDSPTLLDHTLRKRSG